MATSHELVRFTVERLRVHEATARNALTCEEAERVALTADTLVEFEGEVCRWGDLSRADRKAFWQGGYPY